MSFLWPTELGLYIFSCDCYILCDCLYIFVTIVTFPVTDFLKNVLTKDLYLTSPSGSVI